MFCDGFCRSRDRLTTGNIPVFFKSTMCLFYGLFSELVLGLEFAALFTLGILDKKVCFVSENTACYKGLGNMGGGICGGKRFE